MLFSSFKALFGHTCPEFSTEVSSLPQFPGTASQCPQLGVEIVAVKSGEALLLVFQAEYIRKSIADHAFTYHYSCKHASFFHSLYRLDGATKACCETFAIDQTFFFWWVLSSFRHSRSICGNERERPNQGVFVPFLVLSKVGVWLVSIIACGISRRHQKAGQARCDGHFLV